MRLYFIRHGQSENNVLNQTQYETSRKHDPLLTDIGQEQAQRIADFLVGAIDMPHPDLEPIAFTKLFVSPMIRALDTAKPIVEALGIVPEVWTDIHEIGGLFTADVEDNITSFPGLTTLDFAERYTTYTLPENVTDTGWWNSPSGRETPDQFLARAIRVAMKLREYAHTNEQIVLVAHAAFLDALIKALLNQLPMHPNTLFYNHYNTGLSRIDFAETIYSSSPDHMRIHYLNRAEHLPPELRTW